MRFQHETHETRVIFGSGRSLEVVDEVARLGGRPFTITGGSATTAAAPLLERLAAIEVGRIGKVRRHVPIEDAEVARRRADELGASVLIAVGGGSAIGLAKAVALTSGPPIVAVPTTYSGSEMTPVWGLTEDGVKTTGRDRRVAPSVVVYDPELTYSLPPSVTASSGMNAIAHCVDSLWAPGRDPLTDAMSERGLAALAASLPGAVRDGAQATSREVALVGAWLAGSAFAAAGSSVHHKICHVLGGRYDLPHAQTHAAVLPWSTRLALRHQPAATGPLERALGGGDPVIRLRALAAELGATRSLAELGLAREQAIETAEEIPLEVLATPFPVGREEMRELLIAAVEGSDDPESCAPPTNPMEESRARDHAALHGAAAPRHTRRS
jgi:alcohol dehydrogenase class IV